MIDIIKETKKTITVEVAHTYKTGGGDVLPGTAKIMISKVWLAQQGMTVEQAAKNHVQTKIMNFHSFLGE